MESEANPYRVTDDFGSYQGDCADLPYFLRAYYAWKNGLPFSYQDRMRTADGAKGDERYSAAGNIVASRRDVVTEYDEPPVSGPDFLREIHGLVSTAMFRTHPAVNEPPLFDDFYPVEISRDAIRPGLLAYDVFGHVGVVYDVTEDGRILLMASHPNYAVTRTVYGQNFQRAHPSLGAGIKPWRPIRLENATLFPDGSYRGGQVTAADNSDLDHFSLEQQLGVAPHDNEDWSQGRFVLNGVALPYYDYVRRALARPGFAYDPVREVAAATDAICLSAEARARAVDRAAEEGLPNEPHPDRLPRNIFGADGDWERHATPARDARLKVQFVELRELAEFLIERHAAGDPSVSYEGEDLPADLLETFDRHAAACEIAYRRSDGAQTRLNLGDVMERLFDLSFDPYQCTERRWGARGAELEACPSDEAKTSWYEALTYLRNQTTRDLTTRTDFALDELRAPTEADAEEGGVGWARPPEADLRAYLRAAVAAGEGDEDPRRSAAADLSD